MGREHVVVGEDGRGAGLVLEGDDGDETPDGTGDAENVEGEVQGPVWGGRKARQGMMRRRD